MDGHFIIEDSLENVLQKDGSVKATDKTKERLKQQNVQTKLAFIINSHYFMVTIIILVILDCLCVLVELLLELKVVEIGPDHVYVRKILHYVGIFILSLFLIELAVRLYVMRLAFFTHKLEVFDAIIIIVSFILDIVFTNSDDASIGAGFLVLLRLWRVARIINGIVMTVERKAENDIEKEREHRRAREAEVMKLQEYCTMQGTHIAILAQLLQEHKMQAPHINSPEISKINSPVNSNISSPAIIGSPDMSNNSSPAISITHSNINSPEISVTQKGSNIK